MSNEFKLTHADMQVPTVDERIDMIRAMVRMVLNGEVPAMLLAGDPGIGKTWIVMDEIRRAMKKEYEDYILNKGHLTPFPAYQLMYACNELLLILDDTDSLFKTETGNNMLKAALDSEKVRRITYNSGSRGDLPASFDYMGSMIFISNRDISTIDPAVRSRCMNFNYTMTNAEVLGHLAKIMPHIEPDADPVHKSDAYKFMVANEAALGKLNLRIFGKIVAARATYDDWMSMAYHCCRDDIDGDTTESI